MAGDSTCYSFAWHIAHGLETRGYRAVPSLATQPYRTRRPARPQLRKEKKDDGLQKRRRSASGGTSVPESSVQQPQARSVARAADPPDAGLAETLKSLPDDVRLLGSQLVENSAKPATRLY